MKNNKNGGGNSVNKNNNILSLDEKIEKMKEKISETGKTLPFFLGQLKKNPQMKSAFLANDFCQQYAIIGNDLLKIEGRVGVLETIETQEKVTRIIENEYADYKYKPGEE